MSLATRTRRLLYLIHRWMGVAACVLMALWFVSGIVMLFIGYPKLTPWERLSTMPPLRMQQCCIPLDRALSAAGAPVKQATLTSIGGKPFYRLLLNDDRLLAIDAVTGERAAIGPQHILASARAFLPNANAHDEGIVWEDRWTHGRALDPHRPLHVMQMDDADNTRLYLSSSTSEVVLNAPRAQRAWNYVGAWLHWLYYFRDRPVDPGWSWIVIVLSAIGTLVAISGTIVGVWRWRFGRRYKSGSRSPYREPWLRWHHILGLLFSAIIFTWIFSGLMSMNPFGVFNARGPKPDLVAWRGGDAIKERLPLEASEAIALLQHNDFQAVEINWRILDGQPYLLARNAAGGTRLVVRDNNGFTVHMRWSDEAILHAASRLMHAPPTTMHELTQYDDYYYARQPEAMMGASERRLPVWQAHFNDPHATVAYLDPWTGDVALSLDRAQRTGRWLFNFLHSWDLPAMLRSSVWRDAVLVLLSLGGLAMSLSGVVIGWRRLRIRMDKTRHHS